MLTSDDRSWICSTLELVIREIVDASKGDGPVAAHNFRTAYNQQWEKFHEANRKPLIPHSPRKENNDGKGSTLQLILQKPH